MVLRSFLLYLIILTSLCRIGAAQNNENKLRKVKIILNTGTVLEGYIGKSIHENSITLIPFGDSVNAYNLGYQFIKSMNFGKYEKVSSIPETGHISEPVSVKTGFYHVFSFGFSLGEQTANILISNENGYRLNKHFAGGLGLNYDRYTNISAFPIYINLRGYLLDKKISPYYFLGGGYGFAWDNGKDYESYTVNHVNGGLYGQTGVGYQIQYSRIAVSFNVGYRIQRTRLDYEYKYYYYYDLTPWSSFAPTPAPDNMIVIEKRQIRRVVLTLSVIF